MNLRPSFSLFFRLVVPAIYLTATGQAQIDPEELPTEVQEVAAAEEGKMTYTANEEWVAIDVDPMRLPKDNALDFSRFLDAPAGKHGEIIVKGDRFVFANAPDRKVQFFGTNLTHESPYLSKEESEKIAHKLAAEGFNAVRIHLYEKWLTQEDGSTTFDPEQKDKLDYLIHCLREKGIYYVTTLYSGANFKPGVVADIESFRDKEFRFEMKGLLMVSDDAMRYLKEYSKNLLTSVNPYTGVSLKDDPAMIGVELTNENALLMFRIHYPEFTPIFTEKCREYLTQKNGKPPTDSEVEAFYNQHLLILQERFFDRVSAYLRDELKVTKPITDITHRSNLAYTPIREKMGYVDIHAYWHLYQYTNAKFGAGMFTKSRTPTKSYYLNFEDPIKGSWIRLLRAAGASLMEKPFASTEFNMCYPAPQRAFTIPLQSALAGLQGWDMILHYGYATNPNMMLRPHPERWLNVATSPLFLLSERIGGLLFGQGEVAPSDIRIPLVITRDYLDHHLKTNYSIQPPADYINLGWACRIGVIMADDDTDLSAYPAVVVPNDMAEIPASVKAVRHHPSDSMLLENLKDILPGQSPGRMTSSTGQVTLDSQQSIFTLATPKAECVLLSNGASAGAANRLSVEGNTDVATCFVGAIDEVPLAESNRYLVLYLTDLKNTGTIISPTSEDGRPVVLDPGELPHLMQQGAIQFSIKSPDRPLPKIWALKFDGSRAHEVSPTKTDDGFSFVAQAVTSSDTYGAYEVIWE